MCQFIANSTFYFGLLGLQTPAPQEPRLRTGVSESPGWGSEDGGDDAKGMPGQWLSSHQMPLGRNACSQPLILSTVSREAGDVEFVFCFFFLNEIVKFIHDSKKLKLMIYGSSGWVWPSPTFLLHLHRPTDFSEHLMGAMETLFKRSCDVLVQGAKCPHEEFSCTSLEQDSMPQHFWNILRPMLSTPRILHVTSKRYGSLNPNHDFLNSKGRTLAVE